MTPFLWFLGLLFRWIDKNKAAPIVQGLIFSHSLLEYTLLVVMMDHLIQEWKQHLSHAAAIINFCEGFTAVLSVYVTHVSDYHLGHYQAVLYSNVIYISALLIMIVFVGSPGIHDIKRLYVALGLLSVGKAGIVPLKAFIDDQLRKWDTVGSSKDLENNRNREGVQNRRDSEEENNKSNNEQLQKNNRFLRWRCIQMKLKENKEGRDRNPSNLWWNIPWSAGIVVAVFWNTHWMKYVKVSAMVMVSALLWFWSGKWFGVYEIEEVSFSPLARVYYVLKASISKRNIPYPISPADLFDNESHRLPLLPDNKYLRWLDKAAAINHSTGFTSEEQNRKRELFKAAEVEEVKYFLSMLPLWSTLLLYGLVKSTGTTFFIHQATSMNNNFRVEIFLVVWNVASFIVSWLGMLWTAYRPNQMPLRIGVGMICCSLCCTVSYVVEVHKLHHRISIFCLTPQFILLGVMDGLAEKGLAKFFAANVSESMRTYGPPINQSMIGIGTFISGLLVIGLRSWFTDDLNTSRLDRYYGLLAVLSFGNIFFLRYVITFYAELETQSEDNSVSLEEVVPLSSQPQMGRQTSIRRRSVTRNSDVNPEASVLTTIQETNIQGFVLDTPPINEEQYLSDVDDESSGEYSGGYAEIPKEENSPEEEAKAENIVGEALGDDDHGSISSLPPKKTQNLLRRSVTIPPPIKPE